MRVSSTIVPLLTVHVIIMFPELAKLPLVKIEVDQVILDSHFDMEYTNNCWNICICNCIYEHVFNSWNKHTYISNQETF